MNRIEKEMVEILRQLKTSYGAIAVKADFEAECTRPEEALRVKDVAALAGLSLAVKIGGCEALKDLFEAKCLGATRVVAPMIESAFALQKFASSIEFMYSPEERCDTEFAANIESVTGFQNLDAILNSPHCNAVQSVVMGRVDTAASFGLTREQVDSPQMQNLARELIQKARAKGLKTALGGAISNATLQFFRSLEPGSLDTYETRKIIFNTKYAIPQGVAEKGLSLASEFEILWLENKRNMYGKIANEDESRIQMMRERLNKLS